MDFVNKLGGSELNTSNGTNSGTQQGNAGKEDYLDKGLDFAEKKFGGGKEFSRDTNEKITDGARNMFEKATGKDVPDKFSN